MTQLSTSQISPNKTMSFDVAILNFSKIYDQESFYRSDKSSHFVDLSEISGTNCMCDDAAKNKIQRAIMEKSQIPKKGPDGEFLPYGLHFIDNGNFHYMSSVYLDMVKEPFSLIVLDHHPDMQRPMFDILSCGGWIVDVLDHNEFVRDVHIIGVDRKLIEELDDADRKKVHFYDIKDIFSENPDGSVKVSLPVSSFPIYLSIDKDVIRKEELTTNWDQGEATCEQVLEFVRVLADKCRGKENPGSGSGSALIGADICGECTPDQEGCDIDAAIAGNDVFNKKVLEILRHG